MAELFVIGNGFDRHHGLETSYRSFLQFAKNTAPSSYVSLSQLFLASKVHSEGEYLLQQSDDDFVFQCWSDFETSLGQIDEDDFLAQSSQEISEYMVELGMDSTLVEEFVETCADILVAFRNWAAAIDVPMHKKRNFQFPKSAVFVNFNYTETLEKFYDIPKHQIHYIHGSREKGDTLVVGHDNEAPKPQSKHDLPEMQNNPFYKFLHVTKKPVDVVQGQLDAWLKGQAQINQISVWGSSLGGVDIPYFELLRSRLPNARWRFSYYGDDTLGKIFALVHRLKIEPSQVSSIATLSQFECSPNTSENALAARLNSLKLFDFGGR